MDDDREFGDRVQPDTGGATGTEGGDFHTDQADSEAGHAVSSQKQRVKKSRKHRSAADASTHAATPGSIVTGVSTSSPLALAQTGRGDGVMPPAVSTPVLDGLLPVTEAMLIEQLATVRLLLEAHSTNFLDQVSRQLRIFQQQAIVDSRAEVTRLQGEIHKLRVEAVKASDVEVLDCSEVAWHSFGGVPPILSPPYYEPSPRHPEDFALASFRAGALPEYCARGAPPSAPSPAETSSPAACVSLAARAVKFAAQAASESQSAEAAAEELAQKPAPKAFNPRRSKFAEKSRSHTNTQSTTSMGAVRSADLRDQLSHQRASKIEKREDMQIVEAKQMTAGEYVPQSTGKQRQVFPNEDQMKDKVRQAIREPEHKVEDYYHSEGYAREIALSPRFEKLTLLIIAMNAIWISIEVDNNKASCLAQADVGFQTVEWLFCFFFSFEWLVRLLAFRNKLDARKDKWFIFDSILVAMMVTETWIIFSINMIDPSTQPDPGSKGSGLGDSAILKMVRLLRLLRASRIVRILRSFPELLVLIKGIIIAIRSVFFTFALMLIIAYMFAIGFTQLMQGTEVGDEYFASVPAAMKNMLIFACFPDLHDPIDALGDVSLLYGFLFLCFILLISMTVLNMLVGVLVEVVAIVAAVEKEELIVGYVREELMHMLREADVNGNELIGLDEFRTLLLQEKAVKFLTHVGVDVVALVEYVDVIFKGNREFEYADIINLVLELRGSNNCTVKDVVDLRKWIDKELFSLHKDLHTIMVAYGNSVVMDEETREEEDEEDDTQAQEAEASPAGEDTKPLLKS